MGRWLKLIVLMTSLFGLRAEAQLSCLPSYTALQVVEDIDLGARHNFSYALKSENAVGLFDSRVFLSGSAAGGQLVLRAHFDDTFDGFSLPYNLFTVMVMQDGKVVGYLDFTEACNDPGIGFFPGQNIWLGPIQLNGVGTSRVQIAVWGRL